jgi:hypothetical protein
MKSDLWRDEAMRRFPDHAEQFRVADTPYAVWNDLWLVFVSAYDTGNLVLVAAVYAYAAWCGEQPRGVTAADDLSTCVNVCFTEHIPTSPKALADMPRWFSLADVKRCKDTLSYHVGADGYAKILECYAV